MEIKRVTRGNYIADYKGKRVEIIKDILERGNEVVWYWLIDGEGGNDFFSTKAEATQAAKHYLDYPEEYK